MKCDFDGHVHVNQSYGDMQIFKATFLFIPKKEKFPTAELSISKDNVWFFRAEVAPLTAHLPLYFNIYNITDNWKFSKTLHSKRGIFAHLLISKESLTRHHSIPGLNFISLHFISSSYFSSKLDKVVFGKEVRVP